MGVSINGNGRTVTVNKEGEGSTITINRTEPRPTFMDLTRTQKPLLKIGMLGDSHIANALGGQYRPEGGGLTPMRMTYNNYFRFLYEELSWNKPSCQRAGENWTFGGTWSPINNTTIWEPTYSNEAYRESVDPSAYVQATVPSGKENFAIICQKFTGFGKLNVTLNGGSIAAYGPTQIDLSGTGFTGNPDFTVEYLGLPAGINTIRFTKEANADKVRVWGGFNWTGNTLMVYNVAHGGHTMQELIAEHLTAEVIGNDFDGILFMLTEMNELSAGRTTQQSLDDLQTIIDDYIGLKPCFIASCVPFGTDPTDGTPNWYTTYQGQKALNTALMQKVIANDIDNADIFTVVENLVIGNGGTLEAGDAGVYTTDGQHENTTGLSVGWTPMQAYFANVLTS